MDSVDRMVRTRLEIVVGIDWVLLANSPGTLDSGQCHNSTLIGYPHV